MLLDLLNKENYLMVNTKLVEVLGLHIAVYISIILDIMKKSQANNDSFFMINREDILKMSSLNMEEQILIEDKLIEIRLLKREEDIATLDIIHIKFDVNGLVNLIANGDEKLIDKVTKLAQINPADIKKTGKLSVRQKTALALKYGLKAPNQELLDAYKGWIDGVYENPKGFLSGSAVNIFQKTIDEFAKGDLDLALKIIEIATVNGYRDATWAINLFHKDYEKEWYKTHQPLQTLHKRDIKVSGEVF